MSAAGKTWRPNSSERAEAVRAIKRGLAVAGVLPKGTRAVEVVRAFGQLERMQLAEDMARLAALVQRKAVLVQTALAAFDFAALEVAALDFGADAPELLSKGRQASGSKARVLGALAVRDAADLVLGGAEALLRQPPRLDEESRARLDEFDGVVQPILFQAIPLNRERLARLANVAPGKRARLWWYARGATLAPTALDALAEAAEVIHCFPEAASELEGLRQAESGLASLLEQVAAARTTKQAVATHEAAGVLQMQEEVVRERSGVAGRARRR